VVPPQVDPIVLGAAICLRVVGAEATAVGAVVAHLAADPAVVTADLVPAVAAAAADPVWADRVAAVVVAEDKNHDWRNII
jgi:hypothetical protein